MRFIAAGIVSFLGSDGGAASLRTENQHPDSRVSCVQSLERIPYKHLYVLLLKNIQKSGNVHQSIWFGEHVSDKYRLEDVAETDSCLLIVH